MHGELEWEVPPFLPTEALLDQLPGRALAEVEAALPAVSEPTGVEQQPSLARALELESESTEKEADVLKLVTQWHAYRLGAVQHERAKCLLRHARTGGTMNASVEQRLLKIDELLEQHEKGQHFSEPLPVGSALSGAGGGRRSRLAGGWPVSGKRAQNGDGEDSGPAARRSLATKEVRDFLSHTLREQAWAFGLERLTTRLRWGVYTHRQALCDDVCARLGLSAERAGLTAAPGRVPGAAAEHAPLSAGARRQAARVGSARGARVGALAGLAPTVVLPTVLTSLEAVDLALRGLVGALGAELRSFPTSA
ncbi:hypothetical protein T492DRAFT_905127 [Pavlovales sp. CCMP2436]|nr:hypothetical protein T492DRAFT_905127 [Pavlovales sp. CCMP2436]